MVSRAFHLKDCDTFIKKALRWASGFDSVCYLDSNGYRDNYGKINVFIAVGEQQSFLVETGGIIERDGSGQISVEESPKGTFERLQEFIDRHPGTWIPGFLGYDLKNELERLSSDQPNRTGMPDAYFFVPKYILLIGRYNVEIKGADPEAVIRQIEAASGEMLPVDFKGQLQYRMSRAEYMDAFGQIQRHLHQGDCYEINLCQEFYAADASLNPLGFYQHLNEVSPTPFSCFFKFADHYILSASPERFLTKQGNTLLSQPIKGTAPRGRHPDEDERLKNELLSSQKEISENIMIVDLVRNDLTRSARRGTVRVPELAKIHSFKQVHQLISTISCEIDSTTPATTAIAYAFPPGSMTGAPKVKAMELIDRYENSRRGVYAGALGYFGPQDNFDFSVVIRTLIYNANTGYLSFHTGGAITTQSDPENEYNECLLKGKALFEILNRG